MLDDLREMVGAFGSLIHKLSLAAVIFVAGKMIFTGSMASFEWVYVLVAVGFVGALIAHICGEQIESD